MLARGDVLNSRNLRLSFSIKRIIALPYPIINPMSGKGLAAQPKGSAAQRLAIPAIEGSLFQIQYSRARRHLAAERPWNNCATSWLAPGGGPERGTVK